MEGEAGPVDGDRAEEGAEGERRAVAPPRRLVERARRSARRRAGPLSREIGSASGVESESAPWASAFIAVARSCGSGALVIASA